MIDLTELMSVIAYAESHSVKNVKVNLSVKSPIKSNPIAYVHESFKYQAKKVGVYYERLILDKCDLNFVSGVVFRTKKRKCLVLVYFR